jgi:class 3 adenylate cyclase
MSSRILVVDDAPANLQSMAGTLKGQGYQVSVATNGRQALEVVERVRPDLILLDVMMPEMDGFETCRELKAAEATRAIPVIFLTSRSETEDIVKGFELGAVDYLSKPYNVPELLARVNTHLTIDRLYRENERLLLSILPATVATRLKLGDTRIADQFPEASVLFADIVNFTTLANSMSPQSLVSLLDDLFTQFDELARVHGVEKIKTIGDCYMAVSGAPEPRLDHATALADLALAMVVQMKQFSANRVSDLQIRIGLHTGPIIAGVIGQNKFIYDLWGDTVNTASRMESTGLPDQIQITEAMQRELAAEFELHPRGAVEIKGKGQLKTWLLDRRKRT